MIHCQMKLYTVVSLGGMILEMNAQLTTLFLKEPISTHESDHKLSGLWFLLTALESSVSLRRGYLLKHSGTFNLETCAVCRFIHKWNEETLGAKEAIFSKASKLEEIFPHTFITG